MKIIKKLSIAVLSIFMLFACANLTKFSIKAEEDKIINCIVGVEYVYELGEAYNNIDSSKIIVELEDGTVVFGPDSNNTLCDVKYTKSTKSKITFKAKQEQSYALQIINDGDKTNCEKVTFKAVKLIPNTEVIKYSEDTEVYNNYQTSLDKKLDEEEIYYNYSFKIPSLENLIQADYLGYKQIKKVVHYVIPNSSSYTTNSVSVNSSSDLSINLTEDGKYRFYVTFESELFYDEDKTLPYELTDDFLEEKEDGLYQVYDASNNVLYAKLVNTNEYKYYSDKEFKSEYTALTTSKKIIPVFTFQVQKEKLAIKIDIPSYQNEGFINHEYNVSSIDVKGKNASIDYTLEYKDSQEGTWSEATEKFESLKFTPSKKGIYRVKVSVTDANNNEPVEKYTSDIVVNEEYKVVKFKTSFKDWLAVNKLPFVFLCISASCFIAILCLLFINPKEKTKKEIVEEDK